MASIGTEPAGGDILSGRDVSQRVVLGAAQRAGGFAAVNVITALTAILLLRYLGVANFGRYGTVMALLTIVQGVSDAGLSMTGSRELAMRSSDEERRELLGHLVGLRIVLTATGIVVAVAFALVAGYSRAMVEGTALAGGGIFILSVQSAFLLPLVVGLDNSRLAINDVLRQVVLVGGFIALVIAGASLLPFFGVQLVAAVAVLLLTPLLVRRSALVRPRWSVPQMRALGVTALPLAASTVLSVLYFRVLVLLMSLLDHSATQVGYYVTSARIIEVLLNLPIMLVAVVLPVLTVSARDDTGRLQYVTRRMTETMCLLGALLAVFLATGARPILLVMGGSQYLGAASVLQIQCLALISMFVTGAWTTTLISMGRTRSLAIATAVGVTAVLVIGTALILPMGARGAAIAAVAADVVFTGAVYVCVRRAGAARGMTVGPFARIGLCGLPGLALAVLSPLPAVVNCVLATGLFALLAVALGALPPEIADRLAAALPLLRRVGIGGSGPA